MSWWPVLCSVVVGSNQYQKSRRLYVNYGHPQIGSDHTPDSLSAWGNYSIKESNKGSTCGWFPVIFSVAFRMNPQISSVTPQMLGYICWLYRDQSLSTVFVFGLVTIHTTQFYNFQKSKIFCNMTQLKLCQLKHSNIQNITRQRALVMELI